MAPIEKHDPIHEISDNLAGPLCNGESSDCNTRKFGDNHPMANPWHKLIIFAIFHETKIQKKKQQKSKQKKTKLIFTLNKLNCVNT